MDGDQTHWAPLGAPGAGQTPAAQNPYSGRTVNLYDNYYVSNEPLTADDGLYDISKGRASGVTAVNLAIQKWTASARTMSQALLTDTEVTSLTSTTSCLKSTIVRLTGFDTLGAGKMLGPNGNEMDSEEFLSSLTLWTTAFYDL